MSETNAIATVGSDEISLTAMIPEEMVSSQTSLIDWCSKKIQLMVDEVNELRDATDRAKKMKWKHKPLEALHVTAVKRLQYYEKVKAALEAGYYIVPNFPIQMFAIKTKTKNPSGHSYNYWTDHKQTCQQLPEGEGEYQNPFPLVVRDRYKDDQGKEHTESVIHGWDDIEFPITMARPNIMEATSRAMALKIFDQIGVLPPTKKEDPVIVGQIVYRRGYTQRTVSFMIAWHLHTEMISV